MARAGADFAEGMKFGRTWRAKEAVPGIGTEAHDAGESAFEGAKTDRAKKRGEIGAEGKDPARFSSPGLTVTTRKIADFVSGEETSCETAHGGCRSLGADGVGCHWNMTCWGSGENF